MTGLFNFDADEMMSFFCVLVRISTFMVILPFFGDRTIPPPAKVLLSLALSVAIFPSLVARGWIQPAQASVWASQTSTLVSTVVMEAVFGLIMGYIARLIFDGLQMGGEIMGNLMGLSAASQYDPFQESQAQVLSQFQMAIAMLLFLVLDGHHLMLQGLVDSYRVVTLGGAKFTAQSSAALIAAGGQALRIAVQIAAPMIAATFFVNIIYGVMAKAMPQMNILVASFSISAIVGLVVMFLSVGVFHDTASAVFLRMGEDLGVLAKAMSGK